MIALRVHRRYALVSDADLQEATPEAHGRNRGHDERRSA